MLTNNIKSMINEKIIWLNPKAITNVACGTKCDNLIERRNKRIAGGDWDIPFKGETGIEKFKSSWSRHLNGVPLEDTEYGALYRKYQNPQYPNSWRDSLPIWEEMYKDIRTNGYKVRPLPHTCDDLIVDEYITIDIGRDGDIFFHNGLHRLAFCQMLDVPLIPVKVVVRHPQWQELRDKIDDWSTRDGRKNYIYSPLEHPDLTEYKSWWHDWRKNKILEHISIDSKSVLDVGAHWGYLAFALHKEGRPSSIIEANLENCWIIDRLKMAYKKDVKVFKEDMYDVFSKQKKFDTVLFLNLLHHFTRTEQGMLKLKSVLESLDIKEIFFMCENPKAKSAIGFYNPSQEDFAAFVSRATRLNKIDCLGEECGRKLFKIHL